jgi:hypothetical protein
MPPKKPLTDEDRRTIVRQEGKRGFVILSKFEANDSDEIMSILKYVHFQHFQTLEDPVNNMVLLYGYCPLFKPLAIREKTPKYIMNYDLSESEPIVEMIEMKGD